MLQPASGGGSVVLQVDGLCFAYAQQPALFRGWSTCIPSGVTLVTGGESRGKSSLLRLLAGDLPAQAGQLRLGGCSLQQQAAAYRAQVFRTDPRSEAFDHTSAAQTVSALGQACPRFDAQAVPALVEALSLGEHQHKPLYMLSTGSRRKVWLVAAFASGAPLTLMDEPFAGLDKASISALCGLLVQYTAAPDATRAFVLADYAPPPGVPLAAAIDLGD